MKYVHNEYMLQPFFCTWRDEEGTMVHIFNYDPHSGRLQAINLMTGQAFNDERSSFTKAYEPMPIFAGPFAVQQ